MTGHQIRRSLTSALIACAVSACSTIGAPTVPRDRLDYGFVIGESWKQQTLLNIVKLRYGDMPVFLDIAQIVAGYQLESTVGAGFAASNALGSVTGPTVLGGTLTAQGKYTDRPTVVYAPLTGTDFLKKLMTPIPPSAVLSTLQSGYPAQLVLPIVVNSVNGVSNENRRADTNRRADPKFVRLVQLLREMQLADALQIRVERQQQKGTEEATIITFPPTANPQLVANSREIATILHLNPALREFHVFFGGDSGKDNEISMNTRSLLQVLLELATIVQVPASDVATGMAAPGLVADQSSETQDRPFLIINSGDAAPSNAFVAVQYNGHWFWIPGTDIRSKLALDFVMLLFSISDTGPKTAAPVLTVPTN